MLRTLTPVYGATSSGVAVASPCTLINLQGYNQGADAWLQIHDSATVPANGAVPLKSYQLPATLAYSWKFDPNVLVLKTGLYVCISTTENTKTLSAALGDFLIDIEEYEIQPKGTTVVGDLTTAMTSLAVWTRAAGAHRVIKAEGTNNALVTRYLLMFALEQGDLSSGNSKPLQAFPVLTTASFVLHFGNVDGLVPNQKSPLAGVYTNVFGCCFAWSTSAVVWADPGSDDGTLKVTYKSL
jgi:hypothetical protein